MKLPGTLAAIGLAVCLTTGAASAKDWKTVRIGMDATYPPFESVDSKGAITGWEVEYAKALCAKMSVTCTFQNQDWDGIIPALLAGKFDVIFSSMNETPARMEKVLFSKVYYATPPAFATSASNKSNDISPEALKGKTIGTQSSTTFANYLEKFYKGSDVKLYPGGDEPQIDLANGRIDYDLGDSVVIGNFIEKSGNGCCRIAGLVERDKTIFGAGVGAAFRKEDADLAAKFNAAIDEADKDGTFKKLETPYFKIDIRGE